MCAAAEGKAALAGGDDGVPDEDVLACDFNLAEELGIGSHW